MASPPTLSSDRLVLRPFTLDDAGDVQRLAGAPAVAETTLNVPHPYEDGMAEAWIETHPAQFEGGEDLVFAMTLRDTGELVGAMGLRGFGSVHRRAEMGYWVGTPYWGRGYATEAARRVVAYGFGDLGLNRIHAHYMAKNPASGRVLQKAGMRREGALPGHIFKAGRYEDIELYGVLASEWPVPDNEQGD